MLPIRVYHPGPTLKLNYQATLQRNLNFLFNAPARQLARTAILSKSALQKQTEFAALLSVLKTHSLKTLLEIGTYKGGTLYGLCQLAHPKATILSLDFGTHSDITFNKQETQKFQSYIQPSQNLVCLKRDSHEPSSKTHIKKLLGRKKLDLLFIDGDHKYDGVMQDFIMYSSLVKKGGLILFHDILFHPLAPNTQVHRVWNELSFHYPHIEFIDHSDTRGGWGQWGGIGLIYFDPKVDYTNRNAA